MLTRSTKYLNATLVDVHRGVSFNVCVCFHGREGGQSKRQHQRERQSCVASVCQRQQGPRHPCRLPISSQMELSRPDSTAAHSKLT